MVLPRKPADRLATLIAILESARLPGTAEIGRRGDCAVAGHVMRVAWCRLTATFARRRGGYLATVLLIGLTGGLAMGSIAAARRTQASFAAFLASTSPSDLGLTVFAPDLTRELARLAGVQRVESALSPVNVFPLGPKGAPVSCFLLVWPGFDAGQHRRRILRPGPGHRDDGPDGRSGSRGRVRRDRAGGTAAGLARRAGDPDGVDGVLAWLAPQAAGDLTDGVPQDPQCRGRRSGEGNPGAEDLREHARHRASGVRPGGDLT